jgi:molybdopterin-guanine dinucleotide biosynthesis protein A
MIGVILCGGKSTRMGEDKGLLLFKNQTWAQVAHKKVSAIHLQTVLSIDSSQFQNYSSVFLTEQLVPDQPGLNMAGPLLGIVSVHRRFPGEDLLVLACDLPNMQSVVLEELLRQYRMNDVYEAIAFRFGEQIEPLCSIYAAKGLAKILLSHEKKTLMKQSMMHVLDTLETRYIVPQERWGPFFKNMNSVSDLGDLNDK